MSDRERKTAFACAVAILAASAALLAWLWPGPRAAREPEPARSQPAQAAPEATPTPSPSPAAEASLPAKQRPVVRRARSFLAALLRYEAGDDVPSIRGEIRRLADAALSRTILSGRSRVSPGVASPTRGRVVGLSVEPTSTQRQATITATIDWGGTTSLMVVIVDRRRGRWLVTDLV